jgi:localization factor PodJL
MRPEVWNVAGMPSEAREAARSAARREGVPVGEWLARQVLRNASASSGEPTDMRDLGNAVRADEDLMAGTQRQGDMTGRSKDQPSENAAFGRVEDQLRALARSLESAERSQSENQRMMNKAAAEMNVAAREQARAFAQLGASVASLTRRLERIERQGSGEAVREVLKALHLGLTRVAEKAAQTESQSRSQIADLTARIESESGRLTRVQHDAESAARSVETQHAQLDSRIHAMESSKPDLSGLTRTLELRLAQFDERLRNVERSIESQGAEITRALGAVAGVSRLEDALERLERRLPESRGRDDAVVTDQVAETRLESALPFAQAEPSESEPHEPIAAIVAEAPTTRDDAEREESAPAEDVLLLDDVAEPDEKTVEPGFSVTLPREPETEDGPEGEPAVPDAFAESPTAEAFLASVRRSAQTAAAQAEAENGTRGFGGFAWSVRAEASERPQTRYGLIGLAVLVLVLLIVATVLFSEKPDWINVRSVFSAPLSTTHAIRAPNAVRHAPARMLASQHGGTPALAKSASPNIVATTPGEKVTTQSAGTAKPEPQMAALGALDRLSALATQGNPKAEMIIGLKYLDGDGIAVNESEAAKWLERAAESGEAIAQYRLGTLYDRGRGVPADPALALHWYQLAASAGNRKAMHNLAAAYAQGSGTPKDFSEAARWFSKAANLGLADSQFNLAVLYERGLGVPQSLLDAYKWYAIAAASGDTESKSRLDVLSTQLGPDARDAAQHAADQFKPAAFDPAVNIPPQMSDIVR